MNGVGAGKEAWLGFGVAGALAVHLGFNIEKIPPEHYQITLLAICGLAAFSGIQRTIVKWMGFAYGNSDSQKKVDRK